MMRRVEVLVSMEENFVNMHFEYLNLESKLSFGFIVCLKVQKGLNKHSLFVYL